MGSLIRHITIDSRDHYALMRFWREALEEYHDHPDDPNSPEDEQSGLVGPEGHPWLLFVPVPEEKSVKNRWHLDIAPTDHRRPDGKGWVVMADPEGNEFCVERGASEMAAASP